MPTGITGKGGNEIGLRPAEPYIEPYYKDGLICDSSALTLQNPVTGPLITG